MLRLILFVVLFLAIYLAMHALVFWGVRPLLPAAWSRTALAGWMALMAAAPLLTRLLERVGLEGPARAAAWSGYLWMGFLFLAFSLFLPVAGWEAGAGLLERFGLVRSGTHLHGPATAVLVLATALAAGGYGLWEAAVLRTERVRLETAALPAGSPPVRIVQVSDLHLGMINREDRLERVVARIRELKPDLLVATGDVVDAQIDHLDGLSRLFAGLAPPLGKFAVTGNHEFYAGLDQALGFIGRGGFTVLRQQEAAPAPWLRVVGVDDPTAEVEIDEAALLGELRPGLFTLLLKHRPWVEEASLGRFDLQLSGHAHKGQIFPFNLLTAIPYPRQDGLYRLANGSRLYTSRGTGSWGPPMRVLSPPEVTLIELVPAGAAGSGTR